MLHNNLLITEKKNLYMYNSILRLFFSFFFLRFFGKWFEAQNMF